MLTITLEKIQFPLMTTIDESNLFVSKMNYHISRDLRQFKFYFDGFVGSNKYW